MSEHQSIYRPIGTALRQEQFFRNGIARKQATETSQILWNKSYSCLYINYEWLFKGWLTGLCMCLQVRFHKRMGADWTNRNSTTNRFSQLASEASQTAGVSATALVKAQWGVLLLLGTLARRQGHSYHLAEAACSKQSSAGTSVKELLEPCCSQATPCKKGLWQPPQMVGLMWQCEDPLPEATHSQWLLTHNGHSLTMTPCLFPGCWPRVQRCCPAGQERQFLFPTVPFIHCWTLNEVWLPSDSLVHQMRYHSE